MSSDLLRLAAEVELIPDATDEQWAEATRRLAEWAPDLLEYLGVTE